MVFDVEEEGSLRFDKPHCDISCMKVKICISNGKEKIMENWLSKQISIVRLHLLIFHNPRLQSRL